jgi:Protein of unknown function (DUF2802)
MFLSSIDLEQALLIGRAAFLVLSFAIAAIAFTRWRRAAARDAERVTLQLTTMTERLGEIEAGLAWLDSRLSEIARQLEEPVRAAASPAAGSTSPSYPIAIRLARNGATCEELMESCRLSRQEAELVKRLHGPSKRTARSQTAAA